MNEDDAAKREFIIAFFDDLEEKIRFLPELYRSGRRHEARILCTAYLDGLGNWIYHESVGSSRNFAMVLIDHGEEEVMSLVLPDRLLSSLPWKSAPAETEVELKKCTRALPINQAFSQSDFLDIVESHLTPQQCEWLKLEIYRGTIASIVFTEIRSSNVHWLGSADALSFSKSFHMGHPLPNIDFWMLHRALLKVAAYARDLSLSTNKWFGSDSI